MEMEKLMSQYFDLKEQIEAVKGQMSEIGEKFFSKKFRDIFKKYPNLEEICWSAYTPYFNDGEPCVFSSNHNYAEFSFHEDKEENEEVESEVESFLSKFDDELMQVLLGDEVTITINKKGITISECRHD
jgi:hypothetical protein